ncbi:tail fiber protein [Flavobacterium hercynium]|uniref:tail fiber protein n=1 Tax=Flavobacterium hercynium TaxID=387094 RepID=UPI000F51534C|nr:tail fiber protein [Flavobacterium hercynium]
MGFFIIGMNAFSQINSPNGLNFFTYTGKADVNLRYNDHGAGGRAIVHGADNVLMLNFESDFKGGTRIGRDVVFRDGANSSIQSGNFGIGTPTPLAKFEVRHGNILVRNLLNANNSSAIMIAHSINEGEFDTFGTSIRSITGSATSNIYGMQFFTQDSYLTGQTEKVRILGNGNVGIGITNPLSKLAVKGRIQAEEVRVTADASVFPDYVFANDYKLKSLQEVEEYIKQNSHLPEIPSAKEVEANGLMLGEMNMSLLKKIEELTLYMIQQNKVMNELQEANKVMKANQIILESRLAKVETK